MLPEVWKFIKESYRCSAFLDDPTFSILTALVGFLPANGHDPAGYLAPLFQYEVIGLIT